MKNLISVKVAARGNLILLGLLAVFHLLVIGGIIPTNIIWGGRVTDHGEAVRMELVSLMVMLLCGFITLAKAGYLKLQKGRIVITIGLWVMTVFFLLSTIGNLMAVTNTEKIIFTPIAVLCMLFSLRLAIEQDR